MVVYVRLELLHKVKPFSRSCCWLISVVRWQAFPRKLSIRFASACRTSSPTMRVTGPSRTVQNRQWKNFLHPSSWTSLRTNLPFVWQGLCERDLTKRARGAPWVREKPVFSALDMFKPGIRHRLHVPRSIAYEFFYTNTFLSWTIWRDMLRADGPKPTSV